MIKVVLVCFIALTGIKTQIIDVKHCKAATGKVALVCNNTIHLQITDSLWLHRKILKIETTFQKDLDSSVCWSQLMLNLQDDSEFKDNTSSNVYMKRGNASVFGSKMLLQIHFKDQHSILQLDQKFDPCATIKFKIPFNWERNVTFNDILSFAVNREARVTYLRVVNSLDANKLWNFVEKLLVRRIDIINSYFQYPEDGVLDASSNVLPNLKEMHVNNCKVKSLRPDSFKNWPNLQVLDLSHNLLTLIPPGLNQLTKLITLNLGNQDYFEFNINFEEFQTLRKLQSINLSHLPVTDILKPTFCSLVSLRELDISSCALHFMPELFDCELPFLRNINFSHNHFYHFFPDIFQNLPEGASLYISHNSLEDAQNLVLNNISFLDLSHNKITSPENVVQTGTIEYLDLSYNFIKNWSMIYTFHSDYHEIKHVNMSYNNITDITTSMGRSMNFVTSIDLGKNAINCSNECYLAQLQTWLTENSANILILNSKGNITCSEPIISRNKSVLDVYVYPFSCDHVSGSEYLITFTVSSIFIVTSFLAGYFIYSYRFEIIYIRHIWRMKRKAEKQITRKFEKCKYDAFVSYCNKDRDWVLSELVPKLENDKDKYVLCLHERDFRLGSYIMDNIANSIDKSRRIILILSTSFLESEWCKWELRLATYRIFESNGNDFLVLIEMERLDRDALPLTLRLLMASRTYLEWSDEDNSFIGREFFWKRLKAALGKPLAVTHPVRPQASSLSSEPDDSEPSESRNLLPL